MGGAQVFGHGLWVIEVCDGSREMGLAGQQDVLRAAGEVGPVLLGQRGDGEGVPT